MTRQHILFDFHFSTVFGSVVGRCTFYSPIRLMALRTFIVQNVKGVVLLLLLYTLIHCIGFLRMYTVSYIHILFQTVLMETTVIESSKYTIGANKSPCIKKKNVNK